MTQKKNKRSKRVSKRQRPSPRLTSQRLGVKINQREGLNRNTNYFVRDTYLARSSLTEQDAVAPVKDAPK